jgi:hypothetical protein
VDAALLFPLGMMNVAAMAVITLLIFAEKAWPVGPCTAQLAAGGLIAYGMLVVVVPSGRRSAARPYRFETNGQCRRGYAQRSRAGVRGRAGRGSAGGRRSLEQLGRLGEHRRRDRQPQRLGGLEVDDQVKLGGQLHRQLSRIGALEDFVDVVRAAPV